MAMVAGGPEQRRRLGGELPGLFLVWCNAGEVVPSGHRIVCPCVSSTSYSGYSSLAAVLPRYYSRWWMAPRSGSRLQNLPYDDGTEVERERNETEGLEGQ